MQRRVLSLWFPHLAAERALRRENAHDPARPFAVVGMRKSALRLCSLNAAAQSQGLKSGMALADARAILPGLRSITERPECDAAFLRALGRWSERYTPWVALDGEDGLILDIGGSAHLFGDEGHLIDDLKERLGRTGLSARIGLADTTGAAWALARFTVEGGIAAAGDTRAAVSNLPVSALRIDSSTATSLTRLGLRLIRDIECMPRSVLSRRFGTMLVQRLDQMFGRIPEPVQPTAFTAPHAVRLSLPEPIGKTEDVQAAFERLLKRLCQRLEQETRGARTLRLSIRRSDGGGDNAQISLARPSHDPERIAPQFERAIEGLDAGFGIDVVRLIALSTERLQPEQINVSDAGTRREDALDDLIARIGNRIGFDRVTRFLPAESHIPERSFIVAAAAYSDAQTFPGIGPMRPLSLFPPEPVIPDGNAVPPDRFQWRGMRLKVLHANGPERIAPEWWWDDPNWRSGPRDYWQVQTVEGRRLWLFKTHEQSASCWFAQGEFA